MSSKSKSQLPVIATIIVAVMGVVVAYVQFYLPNKLAIDATQTAESKLLIAALSATPLPSATNTSTPTFVPTSTLTPIPTPVPPLVGVFPLVGDGVEFIFPEAKPNVIKRQFIEIGECLYSAPNGLQLTYDFTEGGGGGWGVTWNNPPLFHFSAIGFTKFTFWVKGASGGETFQIGLKDTEPKEVKVDSTRYVLVSASEWKPVEIPLNHFADNKGPVNIATIENVSFDFDKRHGAGNICIDDVAFK